MIRTETNVSSAIVRRFSTGAKMNHTINVAMARQITIGTK
jgi:hypothetical protein